MKNAVLPLIALLAMAYVFVTAQPGGAHLPQPDPAALMCLILPAAVYAATGGSKDD